MAYICDKCHYSTENKWQINQHKKTAHTETVNCDACHKQFKICSLADHKLRCAGIKKHGCDLCLYQAATVGELNQHKNRIHSEDKKYHSCDLCDAKFNNLGNMKRHRKQVHVVQKSLQCELCPVKLSSVSALKGHMQIHDVDQTATEKCDFCEYIGATKQHLREHIKCTHTDDPTQCDECDKTFRNKQLLKAHKKSCHSNVMHQCQLCPYNTNVKTSLTSHHNNIHLKLLFLAVVLFLAAFPHN